MDDRFWKTIRKNGPLLMDHSACFWPFTYGPQRLFLALYLWTTALVFGSLLMDHSACFWPFTYGPPCTLNRYEIFVICTFSDAPKYTFCNALYCIWFKTFEHEAFRYVWHIWLQTFKYLWNLCIKIQYLLKYAQIWKKSLICITSACKMGVYLWDTLFLHHWYNVFQKWIKFSR